MNIKTLKAAIAGLVLSVSGFANAGLITFESGHSGYFANESIQLDGFDITHSGSFAYIQNTSSQAGNGSNVLYSYNRSTISLSATSGELFSLLAFDGGESHNIFPHGWSNAIQVTGFNLAGQVAQSIFRLDIDKSYLTGLETFSLSSFTGLSRVEFVGVCDTTCNPEFSLDNISVATQAVPEPSTLAIFALSIMGLASRRFKKQ